MAIMHAATFLTYVTFSPIHSLAYQVQGAFSFPPSIVQEVVTANGGDLIEVFMHQLSAASRSSLRKTPTHTHTHKWRIEQERMWTTVGAVFIEVIR